MKDDHIASHIYWNKADLNVTITKNGGFKRKKHSPSPDTTYPPSGEYEDFYNNQQPHGLNNDAGVDAPIYIGTVIIILILV